MHHTPYLREARAAESSAELEAVGALRAARKTVDGNQRPSKVAKLVSGVDLCTLSDEEAFAFACKMKLTLQEHPDRKCAGASSYLGVGWDSDREMWVATAAGQARRNLGRYRSSTAAALAVTISGGYPDRGVPHGARQTPAETGP